MNKILIIIHSSGTLCYTSDDDGHLNVKIISVQELNRLYI